MTLEQFLALSRRRFEVNGYWLSGVDVGDGAPMVLLHGNATWSFMWRNLLPGLSRQFRCVAPDLLGFGLSERPDVRHDWALHRRVVEAFMGGFPGSILVGHDWGGALAASYAVSAPERIRGLVLMEPHLFADTWDDYQGARGERFRRLRDPETNVELIEHRNLLVEQIPQGVLRPLEAQEMEGYRAPVPEPSDRVPIRRFVEMKPIGEDSETYGDFVELEKAFLDLQIPVLVFAVDPGALLPPHKVKRLGREMESVRIVRLGPGRHHFHEDYADEIQRHLLEWTEGV